MEAVAGRASAYPEVAPRMNEGVVVAVTLVCARHGELQFPLSAYSLLKY
jgi:hypothetical protein